MSAAPPHRSAMKQVLSSFGKAIGQLGDRAVLSVLAKTVLVTLAVFAVLGVGLWAALVAGFDAAGLSGGGFASAAAAALIAGVAAWFLFRVVALAVLQFFADEVVAAVELRHYPARAREARKLPFRRDLANALRGIGRVIVVNALALPVALVLLVTGVGAALVFLAVNAWLLGRELTDMAWLRHCEDDAATNSPVPRSQRFMLGGLVTAIMLVPGVNLLAPILGAAAGTHLAHRAMTRQEGVESGKGDWLE